MKKQWKRSTKKHLSKEASRKIKHKQAMWQIYKHTGKEDYYEVYKDALTYLDLGPPVPLGASGDEKPPSITVTGDPAGSMPADTHLF